MTAEAGSLFQYLTTQIYSGVCPYVWLPCGEALLGRVEWEGEKTSLDPHSQRDDEKLISKSQEKGINIRGRAV